MTDQNKFIHTLSLCIASAMVISLTSIGMFMCSNPSNPLFLRLFLAGFIAVLLQILIIFSLGELITE